MWIIQKKSQKNIENWKNNCLQYSIVEKGIKGLVLKMVKEPNRFMDDFYQTFKKLIIFIIK